MLILGIESSCDETAVAVVADGERILSSVVASQVLTHARFGGVVPELASREHLRKIVPVMDEALKRAGVSLAEIEAIAVTEGPGLIGSLLVGLVYGKALALSLGKPLVGVNHLEGHLHAVFLENKIAIASGHASEKASAPLVALVVSGGHTVLYRMDFDREPGMAAPQYKYKRLGQTRDDAAGEAFDKVAKLLALGYPGGPVIDKLARSGDPRGVEFGRIKMRGNLRDFSFSGIKTAVLYRVRGSELETEAAARREWLRGAGAHVAADAIRDHCSQATLDLIASFQNAVVTDLVERTLAAADAECVDTVFVSGGVACNSLLR
ncbi:MAG TPA: tRNA (adenosine(37)-N6)-threonylcarbamoyltransferase complex transferase subunit TsaD, partial [Terriglobia bacterium]|nr:tRNA (adenosine(37)-N6)-threonylcarbamoyltransferase complex transferase subunit TsaD [Terriglobia bacterium]